MNAGYISPTFATLSYGMLDRSPMPMMLSVGVPVLTFAALVLLVWVAGIAITAGNVVLVANAATGINFAAVENTTVVTDTVVSADPPHGE